MKRTSPPGTLDQEMAGKWYETVLQVDRWMAEQPKSVHVNDRGPKAACKTLGIPFGDYYYWRRRLVRIPAPGKELLPPLNLRRSNGIGYVIHADKARKWRKILRDITKDQRTSGDLLKDVLPRHNVAQGTYAYWSQRLKKLGPNPPTRSGLLQATEPAKPNRLEYAVIADPPPTNGKHKPEPEQVPFVRALPSDMQLVELVIHGKNRKLQLEATMTIEQSLALLKEYFL